MIDERTEELASAYVLGALDSADAQAFEARLRDDPELRTLTAELRDITQMLAGAAPAPQPPAALRDRLIANFEHSTARPAVHRHRYSTRLPWGLAAGFALACASLGWHSGGLHQQLEAERRRADMLTMLTVTLRTESADLRRTVDQLQQSNRVANLRIALLQSKVHTAPNALAVSVWDIAKQSGVIVVRDLRPPPAGKDYQLWIIDPRYPTPVDAGVFHVDAAGNGRTDFQAKLPIQSANQFAVTEEVKGGAAVPTLKAMVLAGA